MNIGLILSGGIAKGAYQIGALRAIAEVFDSGAVSFISAASVGAINAVAFSAGKLDDADAGWSEAVGDKNRIFFTSLLKSKFLQQRLSELSRFPLNCEKLYVPLLDIQKRKVSYPNLANKSIRMRRLYLKASIAIPPFSDTVKIGNNRYCDGALADNIPFYPLLSCGVDYVICVYFDDNNYVFGSDSFTNKVIKISFPEERHFLASSLWFDRKAYIEMREHGYEKTKAVLEFVLNSCGDNVTAVRHNIKSINCMNGKKRTPLTGDKIVNDANRMAQHFVKRDIL